MKKLLLPLLPLLSLLAALASPTAAHAQYGASILNPDAKSMAMGGVTMTTLSASHTLFNNASLVLFSPSPFQLSSSYSGQNDGHYYAVSGYYHFGRSAVEAGWRRYNYGTGRDMALDAAYSRRIGRFMALGITGRYLHYRSSMGHRADALAVDLSASARLPLERLSENSALVFGAKLANMGGYLKGTDGALPVNLTVGAALDWWLRDSHRLNFALDCGYYFNPAFVRGATVAVGAEYTFMQLLMFRCGYHFSERQTVCPDYTSVGVGLRFMHLRLDVAYLFAGKDTPLRNGYSLSFGLDF